jgi:hypothetical protein
VFAATVGLIPPGNHNENADFQQDFCMREREQILHPADGTAPIAIGLVVLIAAAYMPTLPVTSAMALVAVGATGALCSQFAKSQLASAAVVIHVFVYVSLYLVFVGAVIHSAMSAPSSDIHFFLMILDLGASALLMAITVGKAVETIYEAIVS